jgi:mannosyltransferase OCH1-like enzyme
MLAWYIPPHWLSASEPAPENIVDAARLASRAADSIAHRNIAHSSIPLILHQTWKNSRIDTWPDLIRACVEKWLAYVVSDSMAYFLWEDDGVIQLLEEFEPSFLDRFKALPANVERPDVFRVLVSKWIGGIVRTFLYLVLSSAVVLRLPSCGNEMLEY